MRSNLLYACICLLLIGTFQKINFEKNIFVYWETGFVDAPLLIRVSLEKLAITVKNSDWKLHLVTGSNIKDFLSDFDHFQDVVKRGYRQTIHQKSDILRIYLIENNGGVWLDFAPVLFQNLDWLTEDSLFQQLIINRIAPNTDDPDMLMISEGVHQSPYSYYNSENKLVAEQYFGVAIHFIAAKKKSPVMTAWKQKYDKLVTMSFQDMMPEVLQKKIFFHFIYKTGVYLSGNIAYEQMIQQKQFELDDKIRLWNIFSHRQNVYEHFKIWFMHGEIGPIALTRYDVFHPRDLFMKTQEEVQQLAGKLWFYLKLNTNFRGYVNDRQSRSENYFRQKPNLDVQTILKNGPNHEECRLFYIVKGSILSNLYENSQYIDEIKTPFITVQQRQQFRNFCSEQSWEVYQDGVYSKWSSGQVTKPERQVIYANMTSFTEKLSLIKTVYAREIDLGLQKWQLAYSAVYVYLAFRTLLCLVMVIFKFLRDKIIRGQIKPKFLLQLLKEYISVSQLKTLIIQNLTRKRFFSLLKWTGFSSLGIVFLFAKAFVFAVTHQYFEEVDWNGLLGQWSKLCIVIGVNIFLDLLISKFINHKKVNTFVNLQTLLKETRFFFYLPLGYVAILHMDIHFAFGYYHAMNIVGGGLLVYVWLEEIKARKIGFVWLDKIEFVLSKGKWVLLGLFLIYRMNRNIRYLRFNHHYLKEYIVGMLNSGFWLLLYSLAVIAVGFFVYKLFFSNKPQRQIQVEKDIKTLSKANIYHILFTLIIILLVTHRTNAIYSSKLNNPYTFSYIQLFRAMLLLYSLCSTLIRLSLSTKIFSIYWILITILSILPLMYCYEGLQFYNWFQNRGQIKEMCCTLLIVVFVIVEQFRNSQDSQTFSRIENQMKNNIEDIHYESQFIFDKEIPMMEVEKIEQSAQSF